MRSDVPWLSSEVNLIELPPGGPCRGKNSVAIPALRFLDSAAAMPHTFNPSTARRVSRRGAFVLP